MHVDRKLIFVTCGCCDRRGAGGVRAGAATAATTTTDATAAAPATHRPSTPACRRGSEPETPEHRAASASARVRSRYQSRSGRPSGVSGSRYHIEKFDHVRNWVVTTADGRAAVGRANISRSRSTSRMKSTSGSGSMNEPLRPRTSTAGGRVDDASRLTELAEILPRTRSEFSPLDAAFSGQDDSFRRIVRWSAEVRFVAELAGGRRHER